ncbi:pyridoxamine 5'-phosphate oxidase family protein [Bacillus massilinigeriensis]|uniref:pyridoxamine 5'-phosphate oxidase family protein n=1 Tax=Bacillus massilionigeriensis TaxID=1805475 RepID=UPI00096B2055|nr:pyridoxamine 5'-phosphate oxidase family protein [Bacillus massilionigeriensis]
MRQQDLEWNVQTEIEDFLSKAKTGYLGLSDENQPYVVPLNFIWTNSTIYFHGAAKGRKMDLIQNNNHACFTVSEDLGTMSNPIPAKTDTAYKSVMVFGKVEIVKNLEEATKAMQLLLDKYVPGYYQQPLSKTHVEKYRSSLGSRTCVLKINIERLTAKKNDLDTATIFYPGKTVQKD